MVVVCADPLAASEAIETIAARSGLGGKTLPRADPLAASEAIETSIIVGRFFRRCTPVPIPWPLQWPLTPSPVDSALVHRAIGGADPLAASEAIETDRNQYGCETRRHMCRSPGRFRGH